MPQHEPNSDEYLEIAEKVRSGEYFREARAMYDLEVHDPMTDRYWYIILTAVSVFIMFVAFSGMQALYPLKKEIPFIFATDDIIEDLPRISSLLGYSGENADVALQRFLVTNYVKMREEYDINTFERNLTAVYSQSTQDVYTAFDSQVSMQNPQSPVVLYQRDTVRSVKIVSVRSSKENPFLMKVVYDATLEGKKAAPAERFQADVDFKYENIKLDENTGEVEPYRFLITGYSTKRL